MIVGTAGHVDHGKTRLVRALTGIDTDRLKEEKARGISIDLGFAYLAGPGGRAIGFVDVPGHERFVRTMVAGAAAIDFVLLVVAADDGVMPQTREHLDVLDLLGLTRGLVVVTKCDRVDAERRVVVRRQIDAILRDTTLAAAPFVFVSTVTGEGLETLHRHLLEEAASEADASPAVEDFHFRLLVDRAFIMAGIGTVVTGTAAAGVVSVGDEVTVLPNRLRARVRSLHVQNESAHRGVTGQRCALGLVGPGLSRDAVGRGAWICGESVPSVTSRIDAALRLLAHDDRPLGSETAVSFHCGASIAQGRLALLSSNRPAPGTEALAQLILDEALPLRTGDRFILREPGAGRTIGGGRILDPAAPRRGRSAPGRLARLAAMGSEDPAAALRDLLAAGPGFENLSAFCAARGLTPSASGGLKGDLLVFAAKDGLMVTTPAHWARVGRKIELDLAAHHAENPDQPGLAGETLRTGMGGSGDRSPSRHLFAAMRDRLVAEHRIALQGHWVRLPGHVAILGEEERRIAAVVVPLVEADRFRPPRVRDLAKATALAEPSVRRACKALARAGHVIEVAHDHFFLRGTVADMAVIARELTEASADGMFAAAAFRDRLDNGRKVAIQILEFFDRQGLTRRAGDLRRVVKSPEALFGA